MNRNSYENYVSCENDLSYEQDVSKENYVSEFDRRLWGRRKKAGNRYNHVRIADRFSPHLWSCHKSIQYT